MPVSQLHCIAQTVTLSHYVSNHMVGASLSSDVRLVNQLQFRLNINLSYSPILFIEATVARSVLSCCDVIPTSLCGCGSQDYYYLSIEKEYYYSLKEEEEYQETHNISVGIHGGAGRCMQTWFRYVRADSYSATDSNSTTHNKEDE